LTFILVATPHSIFAAHGHKLLIISPIIEGLLGGWSTLQGATSAYISDCTSDGSRAQIFSKFTGVFYLGFSVGPALGAFLIRHPFFVSYPSGSKVHNGSPSVTTVFYVAAFCSFVNLFLVLFVFPESIGKRNAKGKEVQLAPSPEPDSEDQSLESNRSRSWFAQIVSSLSLFVPKKIPTADGGYRRDWNLTVLGVALFCYLLSTGLFQIKYLYAEHVYGWNAEKLSYYISFVGGARAIHLLFITPYLIATFKPKPKSKAKAPQSATPSQAPTSKTPKPAPPAKKGKSTLTQLVKEMQFDLLVLRLSFLIDIISHTLVAIAPPTASEGLFAGFTVLSSFGAGVIPAVNSLALCILQMHASTQAAHGIAVNDDGGAGRVFGALATLQSVGQMILGPMLFGLIYSTTVAKFPKAIFVTAAGIIFVAISLLFLLRPDMGIKPKSQRTRLTSAEEAERGRSRISKDLGRASFSSYGPPSPPSSSSSTS